MTEKAPDSEELQKWRVPPRIDCPTCQGQGVWYMCDDCWMPCECTVRKGAPDKIREAMTFGMIWEDE